MMAHHERRAFEKAVRRFLCSHLDAQTAAPEQNVEGEASDRVGQPWREAERAILYAHSTKPGNQRRPGSRQ